MAALVAIAILTHLSEIPAKCGEAEKRPIAPNILLVLADDLGFSDLGSYGGEIPTPHLDSLARDGLRMTRMYSMGRCCPSRATLLSGQYPHRVGLGHMVKDLGQPGYRGTLSTQASTIAQVLQPAGYRSFIAGKWHLGTPDPTQYGFEEFYGTLTSAQTFWDPSHYLRLPAGRQPRAYALGDFYGTEAVTDHALEFLDIARKSPDRPWFLYLAYHAPHFPLQARAEDIARHVQTYGAGWDRIRETRLARMKQLGIVPESTQLTPRSFYTHWEEKIHAANPSWDSLPEDRRADLARRMAIYAAMVENMDRQLGRVFASLREQGEWDNTFILFLSDNGACAEWDPHGFDGKSGPDNVLHRGAELERMGGPETYHSVGSGWANASNTPWRLYKHYAHEGGISTPCIVHWPKGLKRRGEIEHQPGHFIDILPTMMSLANVSDSGPLPLPGVDLLPMLQGERQAPRAIYFEHEGHGALHEGRWKLVRERGSDWELYDSGYDRTELHNLASRRADMVRQLSAKWNAWAETQQVLPLPKDYSVGYLKAGPQ